MPFWAAGVPMRSAHVHLGRCFAQKRRQDRWLRRQKTLVQRRPRESSQDFLLSKIVRARGPWAHILTRGVDSDDEDGSDWREIYRSLPPTVIFPQGSSISAKVFKKLISILAGKEDFARVNAHYARRDQFSFLAEENMKRCCMYCFLTEEKIVEDSEWHSFFTCGLTVRPRQRFFLANTNSIDTNIYRQAQEIPDSLPLLVKLVAQCEKNGALLESLAYFSRDIIAVRQKYFRSLQ